MAHLVKCFFCEETFDRDKIPSIKVNARRYAHEKCAKNNSQALSEEADKDNFYKIVKEIYGSDYNYVMIDKQANSFIKQYGYTWSGMTGCLHWFYNINHGSLEEGHGGIGIIPFIYEDCRKYYQELYKAQEGNKNKTARAQVINFNIQSPRTWERPPHLLDLGDE